jgi:hypothetical protein
MGDDDIDLETDQFRQQRRKPVITAVRPAVFDDEVLPFMLAELTQASSKRVGALGQAVGRCALLARGRIKVATAPPSSPTNSRRFIR